MGLERLMHPRDVLSARARSRTAHYRDIQDGLFPKPILVGQRRTAWPESEVAAINAARIARKSDDEIRALVRALERKRERAAG